MEKIKKCIANLKVEGKLKVYQMTVLVMTLFLVLVALIWEYPKVCVNLQTDVR